MLFENFEFANKIISTYYPFKPSLFNKIEKNITLGYCFTHPNGLYDEISYLPGLIFNPKYHLHKKLKQFLKKNKKDYTFEDINSELNQEFTLPIQKETITSHIITSISEFNHSTMQEIAFNNNSEVNYEVFGKNYEKLEGAVCNYYTRKFKHSYNKKTLKEILSKEIDIIIEDYIWINNFKPFLNDKIVLDIYQKTAGNNV